MEYKRVLVILFAVSVSMGWVSTRSTLAADGRRPIYGPTTITEPGSYILTRDIGDLSGVPTITIAASNVDLDLNGFTVTGSDPAIYAYSVRNLTIHDGFVNHDDSGIYLGSVAGFAIRHLVIKGLWETALSAGGSNGVIEDNLVESATGISASGSLITVRNNLVSGGLYLNCAGCRVIGNDIGPTSSGTSPYIGMSIGGSGNIVRDNVVRGALSHGIEVSGNNSLLDGNVVTSCAGFGLHFLPSAGGGVYRGNTARANNGSAAGCSTANKDFCDEGTGNTSNGDNFIPGKM